MFSFNSRHTTLSDFLGKFSPSSGYFLCDNIDVVSDQGYTPLLTRLQHGKVEALVTISRINELRLI